MLVNSMKSNERTTNVAMKREKLLVEIDRVLQCLETTDQKQLNLYRNLNFRYLNEDLLTKQENGEKTISK